MANANFHYERRRQIASYSILSAVFWLWWIWPWLLKDPTILELGFLPLLPNFSYVMLALGLSAFATLVLRGSKLAVPIASLIAMFHLIEMIVLAYKSGFTLDLGLVRLLLWLFITKYLFDQWKMETS